MLINKQLRCCDSVRAVRSVLEVQRALRVRTSAALRRFGDPRAVLTQNASFSKKWEIPLRYFASCLDPEFTRTGAKKRINQRDFHTPGPHRHTRGSGRGAGVAPAAGYSLPTVQNCPNLFWEATRSPFSSTVTRVSKRSRLSAAANTALGTPGSGHVSDTPGYAPPPL